MGESPKRIVVIDPDDTGFTQLLRGSLSDGIDHFDVSLIAKPTAQFVDQSKPDLSFLVLTKNTLALNNLTPIVGGTESQETLIEIMLKDNKWPVHLAVSHDLFDISYSNRFSALHTLGMLASGVAGVWGTSMRLGADLASTGLRRNFRDLNSKWKKQRYFVYGQPAFELFDFRQRITTGTWPYESDEEYPYMQHSFAVALTLAGLESEQLLLDDRRTSATMALYAERLLLADAALTFGRTTLANYLRDLMRGWRERYPEECDRTQKHQMPEWARRDGFPVAFPWIRDTPREKIGDTLFRALNRLAFYGESGEWEPPEPAYTTIAILKTRD